MVFIAQYNNKPIDASDITTKNKIKYTCLDPNCDNELNFIMKHNRTIKSATAHIEISVSSHFAHINKTDNCHIENFLNSLGSKFDIKFYRKWTEPFIYNSIKNTFNHEYMMHVLYENIMIMTSNKINIKEQITNKENKCVNNEKITWILNCESRCDINKDIIKRNYYDNMNNITNIEYYVISSNSYYDFELYNMDKSDVYLDFGLNKLAKLIKKSFQGWIVELISVKNFLAKFNKILKKTYIIPSYNKIKVIEHNIHIDIYDYMCHEINSMEDDLDFFMWELKSVTHSKNKKIHKEYIRLKKEYGIDYCENIQDKIYYGKKLDYSYNCLCFIWEINNDNFDKYYSTTIYCTKCLETVSIKKLYNKTKVCTDCENIKQIKDKEIIFVNEKIKELEIKELEIIQNKLKLQEIQEIKEQEIKKKIKELEIIQNIQTREINKVKCYNCDNFIYTYDCRRLKNICCINCNLSDDHNKYILIDNNFYILNKIKEYNNETDKHKWVQSYTYYKCEYCKK